MMFLFSHQGNVECRLLTSVFYDFGKEICQKCPYPPDLKHPETKRYFDQSVKELMKNFPEFTKNPDLLKTPFIDHGAAKVTLETFVKISSRNGFHNFTKKYRNASKSREIT